MNDEQSNDSVADRPEGEQVAPEDREWQDATLPNTVPSGDTLEADRRDATVEGSADDPPTPDEEQAAPAGPVSRDVAEAERAAAERGANVKGEGQIS